MESKIAFLWHFLWLFRCFPASLLPRFPAPLLRILGTLAKCGSAYRHFRLNSRRNMPAKVGLFALLFPSSGWPSRTQLPFCFWEFRFLRIGMSAISAQLVQYNAGLIELQISQAQAIKAHHRSLTNASDLGHLKSIKEGIVSTTNEPLTPWPFWPC